MRIQDVISPTICVRCDELSSDILEKMRVAGVEDVIVSRQQNIVGVVSAKDLSLACAVNANAPVGDVAVPVPILDSEAPISEAAILMRSHRVACVPVVEQGNIAGVVTIDRLLKLIGEGTMQALKRKRRTG